MAHKEYKTGTPIKTKKFYHDGSNNYKNEKEKNRKLSKDINTIRKKIGNIAIDRLKRKNFIDFYNGNDKFCAADFTPLIDPETRKEIGFLFATLHERIEDGKKVFIGKAFPALRIEERLSHEKKGWDRNYLYEKFFEFYQEEILKSFIASGIIRFKVKLKSLSEKNIETIIDTLLGKSGKIPEMRIEIYAENPTTYRDLCNYEFKFNIPPPSEDFIKESSSWSVAELLKKSYERSIESVRPPFLSTDITYSVNITIHEWRTYFEKGIKYEKMRYYLFENFHFPNHAFKVIIPIDAFNVWKVIQRSNNLASPLTPAFIDKINKMIPV